MGYEVKLAKNFIPIEHQGLGLGILAGLVLSLTYLSPSIFYSFLFSDVNLQSSSMNSTLATQMKSDSAISSSNIGIQNATHESGDKGGFVRTNWSSSASTSKIGNEDANSTQLLLEKFIASKGGNLTIKKLGKRNGDVTVSKSFSIPTKHANSTHELVSSNSKQVSGNNFTESNEGGLILDVLKLDQSDRSGNKSLFKNPSSTINAIVSSQKEDMSNSALESDIKKKDVKPKETNPLCDFSNRRSNLCDMYGDIRIHGKSYSLLSITSQRNESWKIRPYARKTDHAAMAGVRELTVRSSKEYENPPQCTLNHSVPAIIFSVAGYTGNFFHDFTDVLVPLFLTSYQFSGEVQFLITNFRFWWINKYLPIIENLSRYELIDLDNDDRVHCFKHVIVGLNSHDDLKIDTSRSPNGYSMVDFTKFLRTAYSLPRVSPLTITKNLRKKPRLLIVARSRTRKFTNLRNIVKMAQKSGYEVIVGEAESNVTHFAQIVNTCDVMMGVHGAGLTNFVFLPTNAILIQIVPWGRLDWIAKTYFDEPARGMNLKYLEYRIGLDESTLAELYPRDDPVLKDPLGSVHKFGWDSVREMYLVKQNVKLNVRRFRPVLIKALKLLHEE